MPEFYMTEREREVIELLQQGKTATQAASELHVSKEAVSMRLRALRERYRRAKKFVQDYELSRSKIPTRYL